MDDVLLDALHRVARRHRRADAAPIRLSPAGADSVVVRCGSVVVKAHALGTNPAALSARLEAAAGPALAGVLLAPLEPRPLAVADRWVSVWPYGATVPVDPDRVPWPDAATLLARLHAASPGAPPLSGLPRCGAPERLARRIAGLAERSSDDAATVRAAWHTLPAWVRGRGQAPGPVTIVHGDWHLGQLIAPPGAGWLLTDVDDLGTGTPVWDFGRLAALRALGVVQEHEFQRFLDAYWEAGGPALRTGSDGADPADWAALDAVARANVVSTAAHRLVRPAGWKADPDGLDDELVRVCAWLAAGSRRVILGR